MPSPFPGMNPYLEQEEVWQDFHNSMIPLMRELLQAQVHPNYFVKIEEQFFIHEPPYGTIPWHVDIEHHSFLEIRDRKSREVITVIEMLSPSNKMAGADREQYLAKRRQLLMSKVHLVEIDLLCGWKRMPIHELPDCDYVVLVGRAHERPKVGLWPIRLRDCLPTIRIPLRASDEDAQLDLQSALHRLYDSAGYGNYLYSGEPNAKLSQEDSEWAKTLLPPGT